MTYKEVYDKLRYSLDNKIPFAVARLGDGESMVLHCTDTHKPKRMDWFLRNQFGYVMPNRYVMDIKRLIIDGYSDCDIIGVPTQVHKDNHGVYWAKAESKLNSLAPKTKDIPTTSIDLHSELLQSGLLNKLIEGQKEIVCIFGRDLKEQLKNRFKLDKVDLFKLTPEQRYEVNKVKSKYYPEECRKIIEFIYDTDCKGKLCLVGAGMLGKYYTSLLKKNGGIALDIGHVPDAWAGKITRGKNKGATSKDNTYKL